MRLKTICSWLYPCSSFADIGCDHAIVALSAVKIGVERVYAVDISETAVNKAKRRLARYKNAKAILSDGFDGVPENVELAVLTGLGGMKIIEILQRLDYRPSLILGAQHDGYRLREFLKENGYCIKKDTCLIDRKKYYDLIFAESGEEENLSSTQMHYGKFYRNKNPHLKIRVENELNELLNYKPTNSRDERIERAKEVLKWQQ